MRGHIYIEVEDQLLDERYVVRCLPPIRIGKQSGAGNTILLDQRHDTISRSHGVIEEIQGQLTYSDSSSNGSRVGGADLLRSRVTLPDRFEIRIGPCILRSVNVHPAILVVTDRQMAERSRAELLPGRGLSVLIVGTEIAFGDLNRWSQRQTNSLPALSLKVFDQIPHAVLASEELNATLNRGGMPVGATALKGGDVIGLADRRIEILFPGQSYSVCSNASCQLLNPHGAEANCRWCGFHLAGTGAVSRVIT